MGEDTVCVALFIGHLIGIFGIQNPRIAHNKLVTMVPLGQLKRDQVLAALIRSIHFNASRPRLYFEISP